MKKPKLVTELFLQRADFEGVSKIASELAAAGVKSFILPKEEKGVNTHLVLENSDVARARKVLAPSGSIRFEKQVLMFNLDNKPGVMADITKKIADMNINMTYVFSVPIDKSTCCTLIETSDNIKAMNAIS